VFYTFYLSKVDAYTYSPSLIPPSLLLGLPPAPSFLFCLPFGKNYSYEYPKGESLNFSRKGATTRERKNISTIYILSKKLIHMPKPNNNLTSTKIKKTTKQQLEVLKAFSAAPMSKSDWCFLEDLVAQRYQEVMSQLTDQAF
jgi:hypothetical protein